MTRIEALNFAIRMIEYIMDIDDDETFIKKSEESIDILSNMMEKLKNRK